MARTTLSQRSTDKLCDVCVYGWSEPHASKDNYIVQINHEGNYGLPEAWICMDCGKNQSKKIRTRMVGYGGADKQALNITDKDVEMYFA